MTTTPARPVTCPAWCRTHHVAERLRWARMQEQSARYMRAPENQPRRCAGRLRRAFAPGFTPPAADGRFVLFDSPLHELEFGRAAGQDAVPVRVVVQQAAGGEQPTIELVPD